MEGIAKGFAGVLFFLIGLSFILGVITSILAYRIKPDELKTKKQIQPQIKIYIENGISDTTYIYKPNE